MRAYPVLFVAALVAVSFSSAQTSTISDSPSKQSAATTEPEVIFFNAVIYTGTGMSEDKPETVQAMAIGDGKVLAVGANETVKRLAGPHTVLRNIGVTSSFIFPGFNDAHTHLGSAGQTKLNVDLAGVRSLPEMLSKVAAFAEDAPSGHWLTGGNWDHTLWTDKILPTRQDLDKVTGDHPAFLDRVDGHIAIANTAALAAAGITGHTPAPPGGAIDVDAKGEPTGILRESAKGLVAKVIPPPSHEARRRGDELAIADALSHGVTSVQDFSDWEDFLVFEQMEKEGKLNLRISEWLPFKAPLESLRKMRAHHDGNDPMLHTGMLKGFMDGSLGSRTAAMKEPYTDDPANMGLPQYAQTELNDMAVERARAGFQLGFHAIGDKASAMALDAFTVAEQKPPSLEPEPCNASGQTSKHHSDRTSCPPADPRNRIEHAQVVDPDDIPRFVKLGVVASMQPCHLLTDMNWAEERLGPERAAYSYAWKAFLDAGVPLAFGTDYPVEPVTPLRGLYAAVTRMNEAGTKTYFPKNKITRGQALYAYTQGSAYAEFAEKRKGKLEPGFDADFIVVDRDLYRVAAPEILHTQVLETYVAGRQVFAANMRIR